MIQARNLQEAKSTRRRSKVDFFDGYRTDFIEGEVGASPEPQAFLVEQAPDFVLSTHYHKQHQFQLVAAGGGSLGKHALRPWSVHYTSPESGYGPIVAGSEGLWYFTIRLMADAGAWKLPEEGTRMQTGLKKQQRTAVPNEGGWPRAASGSGVHAIIPLEDGGLGAWSIDLHAGQEMEVPGAEAGGGRFLVVAEGSLVFDERPYTRLAVLFLPRDEAPVSLRAGEAGANLIALQFPLDALGLNARVLPAATRSY